MKADRWVGPLSRLHDSKDSRKSGSVQAAGKHWSLAGYNRIVQPSKPVSQVATTIT